MHLWSPDVLVAIRVRVCPNGFGVTICKAAETRRASHRNEAALSVCKVISPSRRHNMRVSPGVANGVCKGLRMNKYHKSKYEEQHHEYCEFEM